MNLKIDDLEKNSRKGESNDEESGRSKLQESVTSVSLANLSVASNNLILQSMKDALNHMIIHKET